MRMSTNERFWSQVNKNGPIPESRPDLGPCWLWTGTVDRQGYGFFFVWNKPLKKLFHVRAHNFAWDQVKEPIQRPLIPDHLCRVTSCVNPDHLEPVTVRENVVVRGTGITALNAVKTHCPRGHEYTPDNTRTWRGKRNCRACAVDFLRRRWKYRRENGICLNCKQPAQVNSAYCYKHWLEIRNRRLNKV